MKFDIFKFDNVTSTNDVAIELIKNKKKESGYVYAKTQTKGRGTHGKTWVSKPGNLFGSIFFPLKNNHPPLNEFSMINPIIISRAIKHLFKLNQISFKWPNDIFVNNKKICGILQELITSESKKFLIVGMGLNIISNPNIRDKYNSTNIYLETNKKIPVFDIVKSIISSYENFFYNVKSYNYERIKKEINLMSIK
jgi:BirA family biotin operon repressor/biotin-[acetyl-CoA-carboxylase] ligase|tara:strand:- start:179 stop:763 length:585 start_codon:yes stop_codon:yes gene_type:complete